MTAVQRHKAVKSKVPSAKKALGVLALSIGFAALPLSSSRAAITNTVTASGSYASTGYTATDTVSVPVAPMNSSLQVSKTASPSTNVVAGQVVTYTYTVKNNGNVVIHNISLNDVHNAAAPAPIPGSETLSIDAPPTSDSTDVNPADGTWDTLAPGDTITFTATYTIKQSDVDNLQ
jgi:large repetitive protein